MTEEEVERDLREVYSILSKIEKNIFNGLPSQSDKVWELRSKTIEILDEVEDSLCFITYS